MLMISCCPICRKALQVLCVWCWRSLVALCRKALQVLCVSCWRSLVALSVGRHYKYSLHHAAVSVAWLQEGITNFMLVMLQISCCPGCRKALPRCAVCLGTLGTASVFGTCAEQPPIKGKSQTNLTKLDHHIYPENTKLVIKTQKFQTHTHTHTHTPPQKKKKKNFFLQGQCRQTCLEWDKNCEKKKSSITNRILLQCWFWVALTARELKKKKIWNRVDCQRSEKRSKTHKRLKECFLIRHNRTMADGRPIKKRSFNQRVENKLLSKA